MGYGIGFGSAGASGAAPPLPLTIPGLVAWWDPKVNLYQDSPPVTPGTYGDSIRTWISRDTSAMVATTTDDSDKQLAYAGGGTFSGASGPGLYHLSTAAQKFTTALNITIPYTIAITTTAAISANTFTWADISSAEQTSEVGISGWIGAIVYLPGAAGTVVDASFVPPIQQRHTLIIRCGVSAISVWIDGIDRTTHPAAVQNWGTLVFGGWIGSACDGIHGHCAVWNRVISDSEATALDTYFQPAINLIADGNSLTFGTPGQSTPLFSYPEQLAVLLNPPSAPTAAIVANVGVSGATTRDRTTAATTAVDVLFNAMAGKNAILFWEATNDMFGGVETNQTAAEAYANYQTYSAARVAANPTMKVVLVNCMSRDAGSRDTQIEAFNALLAADFTVATSSAYVWLPSSGTTSYGAKMLVDLFSVPQLRDSTNATYFQSDQLHLTTAGYGVVASVTQAALILLP